jgi:hypothetical protein
VSSADQLAVRARLVEVVAGPIWTPRSGPRSWYGECPVSSILAVYNRKSLARLGRNSAHFCELHPPGEPKSWPTSTPSASPWRHRSHQPDHGEDPPPTSQPCIDPKSPIMVWCYDNRR